ncbi:hypothetical protein CsSME_00019379 [Camellia sinensis var. sinensis]
MEEFLLEERGSSLLLYCPRCLLGSEYFHGLSKSPCHLSG